MSRIRIWSPTPSDIDGSIGDGMVACLAAAFASGPWANSPMHVGHDNDPHSARGIVASLSGQGQVVVASTADADGETVVGCVLGGILDSGLIDSYRLAPFGARVGDGLLAYIGVSPRTQGSRVRRVADGSFHMGTSGAGLSSLLFESWLALSTVTACPSVFVRTRQVLKPIIHLAEKNGFDYRGGFTLDFNGEEQDRIVFGRDNRRVLH